jgi:hypothetical protein
LLRPSMRSRRHHMKTAARHTINAQTRRIAPPMKMAG